MHYVVIKILSSRFCWNQLQLYIKWEGYTASISKFSDSENAPKNLENMCNYASIFLSWKWRKNLRFVQKVFSAQKILRKAQISPAFFDVVNCNNECKPVKPQLSKNHEKTCAFLNIFFDLRILNKFYIFIQFFGSKNGGKIGHIIRSFLEHFLDKKILRCLQCYSPGENSCVPERHIQAPNLVQAFLPNTSWHTVENSKNTC